MQWACRVARDAKEKYGGVIKFNVDGTKFAALTGRKFNLTSLDQADYTQRQKEWINFITSYGRKPDPVFQRRRSGGVWLHERRDPPQALNYTTPASTGATETMPVALPPAMFLDRGDATVFVPPPPNDARPSRSCVSPQTPAWGRTDRSPSHHRCFAAEASRSGAS